MLRKVTASALVAGLAAAAAAVAQPNLPKKAGTLDSDDIVVEGRQIRALATDFVERVLPIGKRTQFGRFDDPICPSVVGLGDKVEKEVGDRMMAVGKAVNVAVESLPCSPNVVLIVVPDKKAAIAEFRKVRPEYVKGMSPDMLNALAESPRPYAAWQLAQLVASDGMFIGESRAMASTSDGATDGKHMFYDKRSALLKSTESPSRLRSTVKPQVKSAIILVEAAALNNLDTRQLADFALMQAMLPANRMSDEPPAASILNVFETLPIPNDAPQSLTHVDVAFLKSMASVRSDMFSAAQRNEIRGQMIEELEKTRNRQN